MNKKGFTLIEMLVVVAVIGLLSSVILTALGPARNKAKDARIISDINQVRSLAETIYVNGIYQNLPTLPSINEISNENIRELADDITMQGGELTIIKSAGSKGYSAFSRINITGGDFENPKTQYYCVDSAGHSVFTFEEPSDSICPSS